MSLKDKASKIDFNNLSGMAAAAPVASRNARTVPGQLMELAASQREDLVARVKELETQLEASKGLEVEAARAKQLETELLAAQAELQQWDGVKGTRLIAASDIVPSQFANRHVLNFRSAQFEQLKAEIKSAGGNIQPVKVRPLAQPRDGAHFELVYGHRRHEACLQLGLPVLALVDNVDDQLMFVEMDRENRARLDLSPWEQGVMYKRGLELQLFSSLRAMSEEIGVNVSTVSRTLALAELPQEVIDAFASPMDLQFRWAKPLADALKADREGVLNRARELQAADKKLPAPKVFAQLVSEEVLPSSETRPIKVAGKEVATLEISKRGIQIRIKPNVVPESQVIELSKLIESFLETGAG